MEKVEKAIYELLETEPFYAHFFLNCELVYTRPDIPRAAASITPEGPRIYMNREYVTRCPDLEVQWLIKHEISHILFEHCTKMTDPSLNKGLANIAMDLAINQYLGPTPADYLTIPLVEKQSGVTLAPRETWIYYYNALKPKVEQLKKEGESHGDSHGVDPAEGVSPEMARQYIQGAADKAIKGSKGNLPLYLKRAYHDLQPSQLIPWQQVLSNFVGRNTSSISRHTRSRANRRYGLSQPGKKKKREISIGFCLDSSGSVSDSQYQKALSVVLSAIPHCGVVYVIDADCQVQDVQKVRKGGRLKLTRVGGGGTAYQPAITKCVELNPDIIIYCGDMDSADTPVNPGIPFLWLILGEGKPPADFGEIIRISEDL